MQGVWSKENGFITKVNQEHLPKFEANTTMSMLVTFTMESTGKRCNPESIGYDDKSLSMYVPLQFLPIALERIILRIQAHLTHNSTDKAYLYYLADKKREDLEFGGVAELSESRKDRSHIVNLHYNTDYVVSMPFHRYKNKQYTRYNSDTLFKECQVDECFICSLAFTKNLFKKNLINIDAYDVITTLYKLINIIGCGKRCSILKHWKKVWPWFVRVNRWVLGRKTPDILVLDPFTGILHVAEVKRWGGNSKVLDGHIHKAQLQVLSHAVLHNQILEEAKKNKICEGSIVDCIIARKLIVVIFTHVKEGSEIKNRSCQLPEDIGVWEMMEDTYTEARDRREKVKSLGIDG